MAHPYNDFANIDSDTDFDELWLAVSENYVSHINAAKDDIVVARVEKAERSRHGPVDSTHESYTIARDAVVDGNATVSYYFGPASISDGQLVYAKDDVPAEYKYLLRGDDFSTDVAAQEQQVEDVRWSELTFFKYIDATDIAVPVPSLADGDVDGMIEDMETGGWYQLISTAYTNRGTNSVLRTAIVSYEYVGSTDTATVNVNVVPANNLRYSTNGVDFTDDPPDDEDEITHIEWTVGGEVIDIRIKPETALINPVENLINEIYPPWQSSPTSPVSASFSGADFNRNPVERAELECDTKWFLMGFRD